MIPRGARVGRARRCGANQTPCLAAKLGRGRPGCQGRMLGAAWAAFSNKWVATQTCRGPRKQAIPRFAPHSPWTVSPVSSDSRVFFLETTSSLSTSLHRRVFLVELLAWTLWFPKLYSPPGCVNLGALTPEDPTPPCPKLTCLPSIPPTILSHTVLFRTLQTCLLLTKPLSQLA